MIKWATVLGVVALIIISMYFVYLYRQIRDFAARDEARPADVIVILGAAQYNGRPSPVLKARLDHARDLYRRGFAHAIITTGGYGLDPNYSEAQVGTEYLVQQGVNANSIITEQGSVTTRDSIRASVGLMQSKGWSHALV